MANVDVKFGTRALADIIVDHDDRVDHAINPVLIPRRSGVLTETSRPAGRIIVLRGRVSGNSATDLRDTWTGIRKDLKNGKQNLQILDDRFVKAQARRITEKFAQGVGFQFVDFTAEFIAEVPYWQSQSLQTSTTSLGTSPFSFTVSASGNVATTPIVKLLARSTVGSVRIDNLRQDEFWTYNATINSGQTLIVDNELHTVQVDSVNKIVNWSGVFWTLEAGSNSLKYTGSQPVTVTLDYRDRYE